MSHFRDIGTFRVSRWRDKWDISPLGECPMSRWHPSNPPQWREGERLGRKQESCAERKPNDGPAGYAAGHHRMTDLPDTTWRAASQTLHHHIRRARADWWRVTGSNWLAQMPPDRIALHSFVDGPGGRRCTTCGRAWVDICWAGPEHVGWDGIACHGKLTDAEAAQIVQQREAEFEAGRGA